MLGRLAKKRLRQNPQFEKIIKIASYDWPNSPLGFKNRATGRYYKPHHDNEWKYVTQDGPWRYGLARGGEGGGKSVAGIIKTLWRIRRGMSGAMVSPDLPHFKKSLWAEFQKWCPWDEVVEKHQVRQKEEWEPSQAFKLVFKNGASLLCGGIDDPISWEGPNLSFVYFRRSETQGFPSGIQSAGRPRQDTRPKRRTATVIHRHHAKEALALRLLRAC